MLGHPTGFWAKLHRDESGRPSAWHPLAAHSADVAATLEVLLERTVLGSRLATIAGWSSLRRPHVARLCALAVLHDAGKVNHGFQGQATSATTARVGHVRPIVEILSSDAASEWLDPLGVLEMAEWFATEDAFTHFLLATWGHHGQPVLPSSQFDPALWRATSHRDPLAGFAELAESVRAWYPEAFRPDIAVFPTTPELQHAFNGVLTLADWIGSDEEHFFPFAADEADFIGRARQQAVAAIERLFLDPSASRAALGEESVGLSRILQNPAWQPHPVQSTCAALPIPESGSVSVIESDTGSGKTEAAVARFFALYQAGVVDGMYFAVPTRSAATQLHGRITEIVSRAFPNESRPPVVQAVPGYLKVDEVSGTRLPHFRVLWDDPGSGGDRAWAAEHSKRYLAGPIVVGTIDQVLLSTLQVRHAHMRAAALLRHFLVIDEVHASDAYMTALLMRVLQAHLGAGGHALLMSATLGTTARMILTFDEGPVRPDPATAEAIPYPLVTHRTLSDAAPVAIHAPDPGRSKRVVCKTVPIASDPAGVAAHALELARQGARVLVIRNLVRDCVATQGHLEVLANDSVSISLTVDRTCAPHHARYAPSDRHLLDAAIVRGFGRHSPSRPLVAICTQTVEQSLDLDADILLTDLCPVDVLLQRLGRLHRHQRARPAGFETAQCIVMTPENRDLGIHIREEGDALRGRHGLGTVYQDLRVLDATWRLLEDPDLGSWNIPEQNRLLVERGVHPDVLHTIAQSNGIQWLRHEAWYEGVLGAQSQHSALVSLARHLPFGEPGNSFPSDLTAVKTRLGLDDFTAQLPEPVPGPFGQPVSALPISGRSVSAPPDDGMASEIVLGPAGEFSFNFGERRFRYGRYGVTGL